jgi:hypothetical protein
MDFITNSGRMTPMLAMPTPDFAVPYAAPMHENTKAEVAPMNPKNGAISSLELIARRLHRRRRNQISMRIRPASTRVHVHALEVDRSSIVEHRSPIDRSTALARVEVCPRAEDRAPRGHGRAQP